MAKSSETVDKVSNFLRELEEDHRHNEIYKSMIFPDTAKMKEKPEDAILQVEYECYKGTCDFTPVLAAIRRNTKLKTKWHVADSCESIIEDIAKHPEDYLPDMVDGFFINRMGYELLYIKRKGAVGDSQTGFIEHNVLRKDAADYYVQQKAKSFDTFIRKSSESREYCSIQ